MRKVSLFWKKKETGCFAGDFLVKSQVMVILSYDQSHNLGNSHNHRDKIMKEQRPFVMLNSLHHFLIFLLYIEANTKGYVL